MFHAKNTFERIIKSTNQHRGNEAESARQLSDLMRSLLFAKQEIKYCVITEIRKFMTREQVRLFEIQKGRQN